MGHLYSKTEFEEFNPKIAEGYFLDAKKATDNPKVDLHLGWFYAQKLAPPYKNTIDLKNARFHLNIASEAGFPGASIYLGRLFWRGDDSNRDFDDIGFSNSLWMMVLSRPITSSGDYIQT